MRPDRPTQQPATSPRSTEEPASPAETPEADDADRIVILSWDAPLVPDRR
jgi:hypothetical protein